MLEKTIERNSQMQLGEIYFWTASIHNWQKIFYEEDLIKVLMASLKFLISKHKIELYGFVIMPNHVHFIWEMKEMNGKEIPSTSFLKYCSHQFQKILNQKNPNLLNAFKVNESTRKYRFWQRDPLAIQILNREMLEQKLEYCHNNPLQEHWNLTSSPAAYLYSSAFDYDNSVDRFSLLTDYRERI